MVKLIISIINRPPQHQMRFSGSVSDNIVSGRFHEAARNSPKYLPPLAYVNDLRVLIWPECSNRATVAQAERLGAQPKDMSQL